MFKKTPKEPTKLEIAIDELIDQMRSEQETNKVSELAKTIEVLQKAKSHEKDKSLSPDVVVTVAGNLTGILAVLSFEKFNIITSKAIGMVLKAKI